MKSKTIRIEWNYEDDCTAVAIIKPIIETGQVVAYWSTGQWSNGDDQRTFETVTGALQAVANEIDSYENE